MESKIINNELNRKKIELYIRGKSVCIVGPAPYLEKHKRGNIIDKYDIIVRLNKGINMEKQPEIFGSRTDILYHSVNQSNDNGGKLNPIILDKTKIIFAFPYLDNKTKSSFTNGTYMDYNTIHNDILKNSCCVDKSEYIELEKYIGCRPTTGLSCIIDILKMKPYSVYITGFTLFKDGHTNHYRKEANIKSNQQLINNFITGKSKHNLYLMYCFMKNNLFKDNIKLDKELIDILNFDINEYKQTKLLEDKDDEYIFYNYFNNSENITYITK